MQLVLDALLQAHGLLLDIMSKQAAFDLNGHMTLVMVTIVLDFELAESNRTYLC